MQSQQNAQAQLPLYERGRQPVRFMTTRPGAIVIRVRNEKKIDRKAAPRYWLKEARPLTEHHELAQAFLDGTYQRRRADVQAIPAKPHSLRLMWRAAQVYVDGNYVRASTLAEQAMTALTREHDQGCWHEIHVFDVAKGLAEAIMNTPDRAPVAAVWEHQADWWTCGEWPGSGMLGRMMDRWRDAQLQIAKEERQAAQQRKTEKLRAARAEKEARLRGKMAERLAGQQH